MLCLSYYSGSSCLYVSGGQRRPHGMILLNNWTRMQRYPFCFKRSGNLRSAGRVPCLFVLREARLEGTRRRVAWSLAGGGVVGHGDGPVTFPDSNCSSPQCLRLRGTTQTQSCSIIATAITVFIYFFVKGGGASIPPGEGLLALKADNDIQGLTVKTWISQIISPEIWT